MQFCLTAAAAAFCILLCACSATGVGLTDVVKAANDLDPGCSKKVHLTVTPMMLFGWAVPIVAGSYDKECKASDGTAPPAQPTTGVVIASVSRT